MTSTRQPVRRGRPSATDPETTKRAILDAARKVFAEDGYGATLGAIARVAGVTAPAISHHFGSKRELFGAVADDVDGSLLALFDRSLADVNGFGPRLRALVDAAIDAHRGDPSLTAFLSVAQLEFHRMNGGSQVPVAGQGGVVALLWRIVGEARADGELPDDSAPEAVVALLLSVTLGVAFYATVIDPSVHEALFSEWRRLVGGELIPRSRPERGGATRRSTKRQSTAR